MDNSFNTQSLKVLRPVNKFWKQCRPWSKGSSDQGL